MSGMIFVFVGTLISLTLAIAAITSKPEARQRDFRRVMIRARGFQPHVHNKIGEN